MKVAVCDGCLLMSDAVYIVDYYIGISTLCSRCGGDAFMYLDGEANEPRLVSGVYPEVFTTGADIQHLPLVRYDTNLYYRDLGVDYDATKRQIKSAYQTIGGESSTRLTMIAKNLLNEETRLAYDLTPPGHFYMDDEFRARMRNANVQRAAQMRQSGLDDDGIAQAMKDQDLVWDDEVDQEQVDEAFPTRQDEGSRPSMSHWTWMTRPDGEKAWAWRRSLVQGCVSRGVKARVAVGVMNTRAHPDDVSLQSLGDQLVAFVDTSITDQEYPQLARRAARQIEHVNHIRHQMAGVGA